MSCFNISFRFNCVVIKNHYLNFKKNKVFFETYNRKELLYGSNRTLFFSEFRLWFLITTQVNLKLMFKQLIKRFGIVYFSRYSI